MIFVVVKGRYTVGEFYEFNRYTLKHENIGIYLEVLSKSGSSRREISGKIKYSRKRDVPKELLPYVQNKGSESVLFPAIVEQLEKRNRNITIKVTIPELILEDEPL